MERRLGVVLLGLFALAGMACGKSEAPPPAQVEARADGAADHPAAPAPEPDTPATAVQHFLKAAQSGDQHRLAELLSKAAREETSKHNVNFELDSYHDADFEVGQFEYAADEKGNAEGAARVDCNWIDRDSNGATFPHKVVWVLRKEEPGWRVVGMITRPFPDMDPFVFNYEDVPSLIKTKDAIEAEAQRRIQQEEQKKLTQAKAESPARK
jgi:hypothetical protein